MHVLSTPPAFVLSQDQTLQQKLCRTAINLATKVLPKESQPAKPNGLTSPGYKTIGTGFTSTLLSSQRTTTHQPEAPLPAEPPFGAFRSTTRRSRAGHFYYVTSPSLPCQTVCPGLSCFVRVGAAEHAQQSPAAMIIGFGRPAAAVSRKLARCPAGRQPYPVGSAPPNPPCGVSAGLARTASSQDLSLGRTRCHRCSMLPGFVPFAPFRAGREKVTRLRV